MRGAVLGSVIALACCGDYGDQPMDWSVYDRPAELPADGGGAAPISAAVSLSQLAIQPMHVRLAAGGTVTWTNLDSVPHTVNSGQPAAQTHLFDSALLDQGDSFAFTFASAGSYEYFCSTHASMMRGAVVEVVEPQ